MAPLKRPFVLMAALVLLLAVRVDSRSLQAPQNNFGKANSECAKLAKAQASPACANLADGSLCGAGKECEVRDACPDLKNPAGKHVAHLYLVCVPLPFCPAVQEPKCTPDASQNCICPADRECRDGTCQLPLCSAVGEPKCTDDGAQNCMCGEGLECRDGQCKFLPVVTPVTELLPPTATPPEATWYLSTVAGAATAAIPMLADEVASGAASPNLAADPPGYTTAVKLATTASNTDKVDATISFSAGLFEGRKFADFCVDAALRYTWFKVPSALPGHVAAPALKLAVFSPSSYQAGLPSFTTFVYEPYLQGAAPPTDSWQDSAIAAATGSSASPTLGSSGNAGGGWWQSRLGSYKGSGVVRSLQAWADYLGTAQPQFMADAVIIQVTVGVGSANPDTKGYFGTVQLGSGLYQWQWVFDQE